MATLDYQPAPLRKPRITHARIYTAISILLFLASLPLPACYVDSSTTSECLYGAQLLMAGCFCGFLEYPTALANPTLIATWILIFFKPYRPIAAIASASAALFLSLSFLRHSELTMNEAGHTANIIKYGLGYWLWCASTAFALIASIAHIRSFTAAPVRADLDSQPRTRPYDPVDETPVLEKLKAAGWITHYWSDRQDLYATFTDIGRHRLQYWPQHVAELHLENDNQRRVLEFFSHYLCSPLTPAPPPTH